MVCVLKSYEVFSVYFLCNKGGSDGSLSGTDGEEQELWEETQIGKGVKRQPGEQVGRCFCLICAFLLLSFF